MLAPFGARLPDIWGVLESRFVGSLYEHKIETIWKDYWVFRTQKSPFLLSVLIWMDHVYLVSWHYTECTTKTATKQHAFHILLISWVGLSCVCKVALCCCCCIDVSQIQTYQNGFFMFPQTSCNSNFPSHFEKFYSWNVVSAKVLSLPEFHFLINYSQK